MVLSEAIEGISRHREALSVIGGASSPSEISTQSHLLSVYIVFAEDCLAELEAKMEINESKLFKELTSKGNSVNATKELMRREFAEDRASIIKTTRIIASSWKLVNECQSRVKHLTLEATNQI